MNLGLPFVSVTVMFRGQKLKLERVLLDTGSAGTIFKADVVGAIGVVPESKDGFDFIRAAGLIIDSVRMLAYSDS